jgi:hypothetical protein
LSDEFLFSSVPANAVLSINGWPIKIRKQPDAAYHDMNHTIMVMLVGQEILLGKHTSEGGVTHAIGSIL